jgi:hypothetical protein
MLKQIALAVPFVKRIQDDRVRLRETVVALEQRVSILRAKLKQGSAEFSRLQQELAVTRHVDCSPFAHVNTSVDVRGIVARHENPDRKAKPGHLVNYVGVALNTNFVPVISDRDGQVEDVPIPANWHADTAEWAAALRAVELAQGTFTMAELGCGWGAWMNITGAAARRAGLKPYLIGVEGDEGHIGFAHEALTTNGFSSDQYSVLRGIAAATPGVALFPRQNAAGSTWGLEPVFNASEAQRAEALAAQAADELRMIPLSEVIGDRPKLDLLHIDIQGGEADLVSACLPLLSEKVAYVVIGTHSRQIEGRLIADMLAAGWALEIERPAIFTIHEGRPVVTVDGVQGWRNPHLTKA